MEDINVDRAEILSGEEQAARNNADIFEKAKVRAFNVMGATGSGKTSLIETLADRLSENSAVGAVAGDLKGDTDYQRFKKLGIRSVNLNTQSKCHLDAQLVNESVGQLPLEDLDLLFVENVGNLICPANFPLGTEENIVIVSVTEGEDMVVKQPKMFLQSELLIINKVDLAEAVEVDPNKPKEDFLSIQPGGKVFFTNLKNGDGTQEIINYLGLE